MISLALGRDKIFSRDRSNLHVARFEKRSLTRAGLLTLASGAILLFRQPTAGLASPQTNPYSGIIQRNVFALKPSAQSEPAADPVQEPPIKIILTGVTTIFGDNRVLMKVPVPIGKAGEPPQPERCYILSEGQSQDGIEVLKVDVVAGSVRIKNHGVAQVLTLAANGILLPGSPVPAPSPPPGVLTAGVRR
jgi:hypothetical protein